MPQKGFPIARVIGIGVVGIAAMAGLLLWLAITLSDPTSPGAQEVRLFDTWVVLYDDYIPRSASSSPPLWSPSYSWPSQPRWNAP